MSIISKNPPILSEKEIKQIVGSDYDLRVDVKQLVSDIGQNFHLTTQDGEQFVFKIANPDESFEMLEAQNQTLLHLVQAEIDYQFPRIIPAKSGDHVIPVQSEDGQKYNGRMLTFLPGIFLADVKQKSRELLDELGRILGQMDRALQDFHHLALNRYWHWDMKHAADLRHYLDYIPDAKKRRVADYWLLQFETHVRPRLSGLRKSVIQNDANDHNILLDPAGKVYGLIDFGDMVHSYTIFELAVALAYVMLDQDEPLKIALPVIEGYHKILPLHERELDILFYLITTRLTSSVIISAYQQNLRPDNTYLSISSAPAWELLDQLLAVNPLLAATEFRRVCGLGDMPFTGMSKNDILNLRRLHIGRSLSISYKKPLHIVRGAMQYLFDSSGNTYLDCVNNVCHVGHCHPRIVRAAQEQIAVLNTNTRYIHENLVRYAQRLTELLPESLNVCYLVNSGSEANELALRLARTFTNAQDCIVLEHAYHGNTTSVVEISPYKFDGPGGKGPAPYIHKVILPDIFRGKYKADDPHAGKKYADEVQEVIERISKSGKKPAAFIGESLPGVAGQIVFPPGYLKHAFTYVREAGGVCIADEVQVGFGRIGTHFWGFEMQNVVPDIVTLGKPIGNGHPLGAVITTSQIADAFNTGMEYFNTFGGNPVSCAIGLSVLDVIRDEKLQTIALQVGNYFKQRLKELKQKHDLIGDVRGSGLFIGIELVKNHQTLEPAQDEAAIIVERMKEQGVLLSVDGYLHNVIKIKPPLVFTTENVNFVIENMNRILFNIKNIEQ